MTQHTVLADIQFSVRDEQFKLARLSHDASGVSEVTDASIEETVMGLLIEVDWARHGLEPIRSNVTTRIMTICGDYCEVTLPPEAQIIIG